MRAHVMHGLPAGMPDAEPLRLAVNPGSASAEEIAELLSAISQLSLLSCGKQIIWKHVCCQEEADG